LLNYLRSKKIYIDPTDPTFQQVSDEFDYFCVPLPQSLNFTTIDCHVPPDYVVSLDVSYLILLYKPHGIAVYDLELKRKYHIHVDEKIGTYSINSIADIFINSSGNAILMVYLPKRNLVFHWDIVSGQLIKQFSLSTISMFDIDKAILYDGYILVNYNIVHAIQNADGSEEEFDVSTTTLFKTDEDFFSESFKWKLGYNGSMFALDRYKEWGCDENYFLTEEDLHFNFGPFFLTKSDKIFDKKKNLIHDFTGTDNLTWSHDIFLVEVHRTLRVFQILPEAPFLNFLTEIQIPAAYIKKNYAACGKFVIFYDSDPVKTIHVVLPKKD
jgi:hypothetical protein